MKRVNLIVLILALISTQLLSSCIDKEFRKEYELIKTVFDDPDNAVKIIEESEFYDKRFYEPKDYFGESEIKLLKTAKIRLYSHGYNEDNIKCITVDGNKGFLFTTNIHTRRIYVSFREVEGKMVLIEFVITAPQ